MCYSVMVAQEIKSLHKRLGSILVREDEESYFESERIKRNPILPELKPRIFSGHFAPVYFRNAQGDFERNLMRYSAYPPDTIVPRQSSKLTTFNARRDNLLSPFWNTAFMVGHGFVALQSFFEWVLVSDLLQAESVKSSEIEHYFRQQSFVRKSKIEQAGKKWKPTATELLPVNSRKIVIEFKPNQDQLLLSPVIFNRDPHSNQCFSQGFAIVTDDPLPEVLAAGHDRTPAFLSCEDIEDWTNLAHKTAAQMLTLLKRRAQGELIHGLEVALA
jgi:putative SOS response-associated peptidase YedK